jgi:hypothetical protein
MEELLEQFPKRTQEAEIDYKSFLFQPERVSVNSRISTQATSAAYLYQTQNFNRFSNNFKTPLFNVSSIDLLRITMSLPIPSIPNSQTMFAYYRIPIVGGGDYSPNYAALTVANIKMIRLLSTYTYSPSNYTAAVASTYGFNGIFSDYQDLVATLNKSCTADPNYSTLFPQYYVPNDISFSLDEVSQKIRFTGNNALDAGGFPQFYYVPVGFADPNLLTFQANLQTILPFPLTQFQNNYTLNKRLGFLWNGVDVANDAISFMYPAPNFVSLPWTTYRNLYWAETFADLVYTQNIFLYCDVIGGSTQDTNLPDNLLAVIPVSSSQLGVLVHQASMSCPLTKMAKNMYEISITMKTDTGEDLWIPVSGFVNIEFAFTY